jgi:hypothetical protein
MEEPYMKQRGEKALQSVTTEDIAPTRPTLQQQQLA